nr:recombinase family protein [Subtercola sp. RTI3]
MGSGRVSTRDQHVDGQRDALQAAGREVVFVDSASGKLATGRAWRKRSCRRTVLATSW